MNYILKCGLNNVWLCNKGLLYIFGLSGCFFSTYPKQFPVNLRGYRSKSKLNPLPQLQVLQIGFWAYSLHVSFCSSNRCAL